MNTSTTDTPITTTSTASRPATSKGPEQLTLLPATDVPMQFRLDAETRRRGLRHIAEIRARLDTIRPTPRSAAPPGRRTGRAA
jgi:hypothetical protein